MLMLEKSEEDIQVAAGLNNPFDSKEDTALDPFYYYRSTSAFLGIKPYIAEVEPVKAQFDTDFLEKVPSGLCDLHLYRDGALCNTTSDIRDPNPHAEYLLFRALRSCAELSRCFRL
ncbi:hypothetical protein FACS1894130_02470 [Spirochaetia bacterium]|nr:hypothetical protein FACS1894130_02470 [Spirochaetia bacterium]